MSENQIRHPIIAGDSLAAIATKYGVSMAQLLAANPYYKAAPDKLLPGSTLLVPPQSDAQPLLKYAVEDVSLLFQNFTEDTSEQAFVVAAGQLTFDAEGSEIRGRQFSRRPYVRSAIDGVTIGRGYRLRNRSEQEIFHDLQQAGVDVETARKLAGCRHLVGAKARRFLRDMGYQQLEISALSQQRLFNQLYAELEGEIMAVCSRVDVIAKFGEVNWLALPAIMRDIVVDLHFCAEYCAATRERVQPALVDANPADLLQVLSDQYYWLELRNISPDRFHLRRNALSNTLAGTETGSLLPV